MESLWRCKHTRQIFVAEGDDISKGDGCTVTSQIAFYIGMPTWPAVTRAIARNDKRPFCVTIKPKGQNVKWYVTTHHRFLKITLLCQRTSYFLQQMINWTSNSSSDQEHITIHTLFSMMPQSTNPSRITPGSSVNLAELYKGAQACWWIRVTELRLKHANGAQQFWINTTSLTTEPYLDPLKVHWALATGSSASIMTTLFPLMTCRRCSV